MTTVYVPSCIPGTALLLCGCGDIRPEADFCTKCKNCLIGCCMCEPPGYPEITGNIRSAGIGRTGI